jgi:hypothetical protein
MKAKFLPDSPHEIRAALAPLTNNRLFFQSIFNFRNNILRLCEFLRRHADIAVPMPDGEAWI